MKSLLPIWPYVVNVKLTVKILSIFLENMNITSNLFGSWRIVNLGSSGYVSGVLAWSLDILIGQSVAGLLIKMSCCHAGSSEM